MRSFRLIWAIGVINFHEGVRRKILYGVLLAAIMFMGFAVLISGLFMRDIAKIMLDLCLSAISAGGLLVPFFIGITLLSGDLEHKTIFTILAQPISRSEYILGKFLGFAFLTGGIIGILTLVTYVALWGSSYIYPEHFFESVSYISILISSLMALLSVLVLNSSMILWCSVTTSSFLATLLTLATYIIGQTVEDIIRFITLEIPGVEITPVTQYTVKAVMYIFPNLAVFDFKQRAAYGLPVSLQEVSLLFTYGIAYITVMLVLAILVFRKRDLA